MASGQLQGVKERPGLVDRAERQPVVLGEEIDVVEGRGTDHGEVRLSGWAERGRSAGYRVGDTTDRLGPLVVMVMAGEHQRDVVLLEERHSLLLDLFVRAVNPGGVGRLVYRNDGAGTIGRRGERFL